MYGQGKNEILSYLTAVAEQPSSENTKQIE